MKRRSLALALTVCKDAGQDEFRALVPGRAFAGTTMALPRPHKGMNMNPHLSVRAEGFAQPLSKHERRDEG